MRASLVGGRGSILMEPDITPASRAHFPLARASENQTAEPAGPGLSQLFRCPSCDRNRQMTGRKLRRVMGLRTWICAECAKPKEATCTTT